MTMASDFNVKATQILCCAMRCLQDEIQIVKGDYILDGVVLEDLQEALQDTSAALSKLLLEQTPAQAPPGASCDDDGEHLHG
jgi:hypothetical protein